MVLFVCWVFFFVFCFFFFFFMMMKYIYLLIHHQIHPLLTHHQTHTLMIGPGASINPTPSFLPSCLPSIHSIRIPPFIPLPTYLPTYLFLPLPPSPLTNPLSSGQGGLIPESATYSSAAAAACSLPYTYIYGVTEYFPVVSFPFRFGEILFTLLICSFVSS